MRDLLADYNEYLLFMTIFIPVASTTYANANSMSNCPEDIPVN